MLCRCAQAFVVCHCGRSQLSFVFKFAGCVFVWLCVQNCRLLSHGTILALCLQCRIFPRSPTQAHSLGQVCVLQIWFSLAVCIFFFCIFNYVWVDSTFSATGKSFDYHPKPLMPIPSRINIAFEPRPPQQHESSYVMAFRKLPPSSSDSCTMALMDLLRKQEHKKRKRANMRALPVLPQVSPPAMAASKVQSNLSAATRRAVSSTGFASTVSPAMRQLDQREDADLGTQHHIFSAFSPAPASFVQQQPDVLSDLDDPSDDEEDSRPPIRAPQQSPVSSAPAKPVHEVMLVETPRKASLIVPTLTSPTDVPAATLESIRMTSTMSSSEDAPTSMSGAKKVVRLTPRRFECYFCCCCCLSLLPAMVLNTHLDDAYSRDGLNQAEASSKITMPEHLNQNLTFMSVELVCECEPMCQPDPSKNRVLAICYVVRQDHSKVRSTVVCLGSCVCDMTRLCLSGGHCFMH
jgi:hypothetical protein